MVIVRSEMALATAGVPSACASIYSCTHTHTHTQLHTCNITLCQFNNVGKKTHTHTQNVMLSTQLNCLRNRPIRCHTPYTLNNIFLRLCTFMKAPERRDICLMNEPPAPIRAPTDELGMLTLMVSLRPVLSGATAYCCCCW